LEKTQRVDLQPRRTSPLVSGGALVLATVSRADIWRDLTADVNSVADRGGAEVWSAGVGRCEVLDLRFSVQGWLVFVSVCA
jgi:hypothetical protein